MSEIKIEHKCSICFFSSWSRVSALPRRPAAYKAAALLAELTRLMWIILPDENKTDKEFVCNYSKSD